MKWFIFLWALPMGLLGSWFTLSYYDINFGTQFFSRDMHDLVFAIYGNILGIAPETVPWLVLQAIIVDTLIIIALVIVRRKFGSAMGLCKRVYRKMAGREEEPQSEASLSSAP